jgi:hypothetical protein
VWHTAGSLLAISDIRIAYDEDRRIVAELRPETDED